MPLVKKKYLRLDRPTKHHLSHVEGSPNSFKKKETAFLFSNPLAFARAIAGTGIEKLIVGSLSTATTIGGRTVVCKVPDPNNSLPPPFSFPETTGLGK